MEINLKVNKVYIPYLQKPQFTQIYYGGSSSGKSYFLAQKIVLDNLNGCNWLCCRNVAKTIRNSIFNEINKCIINMNMSKFYSINKTDMVITCKLNNKQIMFAGLDDVEKVKSITPKDGVLERIFVEEATEIKYEAYKQLCKRLRGRSVMSKHVVMAFNPILKTHWIYKEFFGKWLDNKNKYEDRDITILKSTYKDNLFLTEEDRARLEDESDSYYYNVYTLGNWGILGNVIFKNWRIEDLTDELHKFDNLYYGCDFGYASDPNAAIKIHVDEKRKKIYILDEIYKVGMQDEELARCLYEFGTNDIITCDNSDEKTIDYLRNCGLSTVPAVKGPDSINRGIRFLQGYEIIIDSHCQNFKNEIEQYHWLQDKYGNEMAKAVDKNNHLIDALRYATEPLQFENRAVAAKRV